jgi:hypothetical protein
MARSRLFGIVVACAFALAGCGDGTYSGISGVETVGDAAAIVAHRPTGTQYAATAIDAVDTFGAALGGIAALENLQPARGRGMAFCRTFAGFGGDWVPALETTLGWQGATRGIAMALHRPDTPLAVRAIAAGTAFVGPEGSIEPLDAWSRERCPSAIPTYAIIGKAMVLPFKIPFRLDYRNGRLWGLSVSHATFGTYSIELTTMRFERTLRIDGIIDDGRMRIADLRTDGLGTGDLTITSTGAQYRLVDWSVVG